MNWRRSRLDTDVGLIWGIAPPFTEWVLSVMLFPRKLLNDYTIDVTLHETEVNIKNVRLYKKCQLALLSAALREAF